MLAAALLAATLLAATLPAATLLAATLLAATLLAAALLAAALLAAASLSLTFLLFVPITLLSAFLPLTRRSNRFIGITLCFHSTFLLIYRSVFPRFAKRPFLALKSFSGVPLV